MALHLVYRSYGGENKKGRPEYFDKMACLLSFLRSAHEVDAHLVFVNNGPIAEDRVRLMRAAGEIVDLPGVGVHESYLSALRLATHGTWDDDDVVAYSEDDYLYRPEAFPALVRAAAVVPEADYFGLYGSNPLQPHPRPDPPVHRPRGWVDPPPWQVDGRDWVRLYSTTATFAGRVGALRADQGIFRFCTVPHRNMFRDHDTCLLYQGFEPHSYRKLARDLVGLAPGTPKERLREAFMAPFMVATNLRSHRRRDRRRLLIAPEPNLATHVEIGYVAPGTDWATVAEEAHEWGRGLVEEPADS
ncbi:hypothetical protein [Trujillonella endophytica]|uniref:Glycosyl transferase family 2 n=1 Tax=Trujillonella endophytica TaxID=673521 RepID=A0A1H8W1J5_9ACTN|nr:hypothetical protein [Trujillella endophytica]SEP21393.1 hypothetical protein SAMN05660991_03961 [Trujillella endophytica]